MPLSAWSLLSSEQSTGRPRGRTRPKTERSPVQFTQKCAEGGRGESESNCRNSRVASSVQSIGHCFRRTFVSAHSSRAKGGNGGPKCFGSCLSSVQWRLLCCFQKGHSPVTVMAVTMVVTTAVTMVVTTAVTMVVATAVTIAVTGITAAGITAAGITAVGTVRVGVGAMVRVGVGAMADVCGLAG
jgi:hypothetical protein